MHIVITDLDGSLLDHTTYSYEAALPALSLLRRKTVPLILCSSKTAAEMMPLRDRMGNHHPFIVENGGGIYVPARYFSRLTALRRGDYELIALGRPYAELRAALTEIARMLGAELQPLDQLSVEEVARRTGLSPQEAERSLRREFDLPFTVESEGVEMQRLEQEMKRRELRLSRGGRFFHVTGRSDKGQAVRALVRLYREDRGEEIRTVGIGDSLNDADMLRVVDIPVVIPNPHSGAPLADQIPQARVAPEPGPAGWNQVVWSLFY